MKASLNAGRCGPVSGPKVGLTTVWGRPIHGAWATVLQSMRCTATHLAGAPERTVGPGRAAIKPRCFRYDGAFREWGVRSD